MKNLTISDARVIPGDSAFLIDDGKTSVLYDTGFGFTGYRVAENIKKILGERKLDYIFLTHSHYDHAAGSAYISKIYPDAKIVAGEYAKKIFDKPTARERMRELDKKAALDEGVSEYEDLFDRLSVDIAVNDGDIIRAGDMTFEVMNFPGHTKCSVGFYLREHKLLLGSETLGVYQGGETVLPSYLVGYEMALNSLEKAKKLDIDGILIPHYGVIQKEEVQKYLERSELASVSTAQSIKQMLSEGKSEDEIVEWFSAKYYNGKVKDVYPVAAFTLNTHIMINLIKNELCVK